MTHELWDDLNEVISGYLASVSLAQLIARQASRNADVQPLKLISTLKTGADFKGISVIGYLSHIQGDLKMQAQEAGCDMVMARSAFSQNLPQILKRHSGTL